MRFCKYNSDLKSVILKIEKDLDVPDLIGRAFKVWVERLEIQSRRRVHMWVLLPAWLWSWQGMWVASRIYSSGKLTATKEVDLSHKAM